MSGILSLDSAGPIAGGSSGPEASVYGVQGFTTSAYYNTANPGGEAGSATGFGCAALLRIDSQAVASSTRYIISRFLSGTGGYSINTTTTHSTLRFQAVTAALALVSSPAYTIAAGDVGKWIVVVGQYDGTKARCYVAGTEQGTGTTQVTYTSVSQDTAIGIRTGGGGNVANGCTIACAMTWTGNPTSGDVTTQYTATKAARRLVNMAGTGVVVTHRWSARHDGGDVAALSSILDKSGSNNLTLTGSLTWSRDKAPVFL